MDASRRFRLYDVLPEWLLTTCCWCCEPDDPEDEQSPGAVPLHSSQHAYPGARGEARREGEGEALLNKDTQLSDAEHLRQGGQHQVGGASTSGAAYRVADDKTKPRPLASIKKSRSSGRCKALEDHRFASLPVPTYADAAWSGIPDIYNEDVCAVCLEGYDEANPRNFLTCSHAFHLACILEWEERGHEICPLCDVTVASHLGDDVAPSQPRGSQTSRST